MRELWRRGRVRAVCLDTAREGAGGVTTLGYPAFSYYRGPIHILTGTGDRVVRNSAPCTCEIEKEETE
jgi:hypothetical protein